MRIQDNMDRKPDLALKYIEYLMTQKINREYLLAAQPNKLNNLFKQLGLVKVSTKFLHCWFLSCNYVWKVCLLHVLSLAQLYQILCASPRPVCPRATKAALVWWRRASREMTSLFFLFFSLLATKRGLE